MHENIKSLEIQLKAMVLMADFLKSKLITIWGGFINVQTPYKICSTKRSQLC